MGRNSKFSKFNLESKQTTFRIPKLNKEKTEELRNRMESTMLNYLNKLFNKKENKNEKEKIKNLRLKETKENLKKLKETKNLLNVLYNIFYSNAEKIGKKVPTFKKEINNNIEELNKIEAILNV